MSSSSPMHHPEAVIAVHLRDLAAPLFRRRQGQLPARQHGAAVGKGFPDVTVASEKDVPISPCHPRAVRCLWTPDERKRLVCHLQITHKRLALVPMQRQSPPLTVLGLPQRRTTSSKRGKQLQAVNTRMAFLPNTWHSSPLPE